MPRPNPLKVKACLEKGGETEHTHICRPVKMHLQLFPAYSSGLLAVGVAAVTGQRNCMFSLYSGKNLSQNFPRL